MITIINRIMVTPVHRKARFLNSGKKKEKDISFQNL
jgi:hypothetical protein